MNIRIQPSTGIKVSVVWIALFASQMMSIAVAQQQSPSAVSLPAGTASITLPDGTVAQDAPVPELPYNGDQQCPPHQHWGQLGAYQACTVVAQAGVPFRGWIVTQNLCANDNIKAILAHTPFQTVGPVNDPGFQNPTTQDFDINYPGPNGSWPQRLHIEGSHLWQDPGQWSIGGNAFTICIKHDDGDWFYNFAINAQATVFEPVAPKSITALGGSASPGHTYQKFGKVTLFEKAPASGSLVMLMTEKPRVVDLQTQFGTTGLQGAGSNVVYFSMYVYVPAGQDSADFDALIAASATPGDVVKIFAKCVGIPGNWKITNKCDEVNKHPQVLKVTITP